MRVLMCPPEYFDVEYEINAWMDTANKVDRALAKRQWQAIKAIYLDLGWQVETMPAAEHWPDIVFTANAALVIDGKALLSLFRYPERQGETGFNGTWLAHHGFDIAWPQNQFEGEGDALVWGKKILAGSGFRSDSSVHPEIQATFPNYELLSLRMTRPDFYHIDTCIGVVDVDTLVYFPDAFDEESQKIIAKHAQNLIEVSEADAKKFGCNLVSDGVNIVMPSGTVTLASDLRDKGYQIQEADISEFLKSGGGVKCLTLTLREQNTLSRMLP
jgi:N-dimethylarginine dimethylaminohydrolase